MRVDKARRLRQRVDELEEQVAATLPALDFTSEDPEMTAMVSVAERAATSRASILILGENGTGKSALARHIHQLSPLASGPFVTISCPSLSRELLESELFGHVQGSFTGAVKDKWGKVEAARGGTLFLDEDAASCRPSCSPSCSACCRSAPTSGWARPRPARPTCG